MAEVRRVLMTCDTVGGVWTFALELARGLTANGIEVVLASLGGTPSPEQHASAAQIRNLYLVSSNYKLEWMENPWDDVAQSARWLAGLTREYSPDVVHLNSYGHGNVEFARPVLLTAHSCVYSWWEAVHGGPAPMKWATYRSVVNRALFSANVITAPSRFMATALTKHYSFDESKLRIVYNGRDALQFRKAPKEPFVFAAGRLWDEAKNAATLAETAPSLTWPVYFAGQGSVQGCRSLGRLSGEEMAEWYARAAIYAAPARYEPFGLSILEAALSGCALVLGDIPSLREIWQNAATFVPPDDRTLLGDAIRRLIADESLREAAARRGYERAQAFPATRMTQQYLQLYRAAAAGKGVCVS